MRIVMKLHINGEEKQFDATCLTVHQLLHQLQLGDEKVAVECNLEIVPGSTFTKHALNDNDRIEIVHFIGGG